jgi:geranylgeranyl diphosphate synthase type II
MHSLEDFRKQVEKSLKEFSFNDHPRELYDPIYYMLDMGGKRIRPAMVLAACEMFGGDYKEALPAALAIEVFHNFTLVHDDIMDQAPLRRGKETVYQKWNTPVAILVGDTMLSLAYDQLIQVKEGKLPEIIGLFNKTSIEVCEGQQMDMNFETADQVTIDEYLEMIRLKTAVLLAASLKIGAAIGGADAGNKDRIYKFGEAIGLAFQLKDDYLDVFGKQELFGKQASGDIVTNKKTYLFLKALELSATEDRQKLKELYKLDLNDNMEKIKTVRGIFEKYEIDRRTMALIQQYHDEAIRLLVEIGVPDDKKQILHSIAGQIVERNF